MTTLRSSVKLIFLFAVIAVLAVMAGQVARSQDEPAAPEDPPAEGQDEPAADPEGEDPPPDPAEEAPLVWSGETRPPIDLYFVIDNSVSMNRIDPENRRIEFTQALADLILSRGGDRVCVIRLGGMFESEEWQSVVMPLSVVPEEAELREIFLGKVREALASRTEGFGRASDFYAAFKKGVSQQMGEREHKEAEDTTPSVIVVVSDGHMEVIEGDRVPDDYLTAAENIDGPTLRDRVNAAAFDIFRREILPALSNPVNKTYVLPVRVSNDEGEKGLYVLKDLAAIRTSGRLIELGDNVLDAVARALNPFTGLTTPPWNYIPVQRVEEVTVEPGAETVVDINLPIEAVSSRILVFGQTADYSVGLTGTGPARLGTEEGVRIYSRFQKHRVIEALRQPIPSHQLHIQNSSEEPAVFSAVVSCAFRFETTVNMAGGDAPLHGGDSLKADIALIVPGTGKPVSDPFLMSRLEARVRMMDASGEAVERRFRYNEGGSASKPWEYVLETDTPIGPFIVSVSHVLLDQDGAELASVKPVERDVTLEAAPTICQVNFEKARVFRGHDILLTGALVTGQPRLGEIDIVLDGPASSDNEEGVYPVSLAWDGAANGYAGRFAPPLEGRYAVRESGVEGWKVESGLHGAVDVLRRGVFILAEDGNPLDSIAIPRGPEAADAGFQPVSFLVTGDLLPGESGELTLSTKTHQSVRGASLSIEGGESIELTSKKPSQKVTLRIDAEQARALGGELGRIEIKGTLGGEAVRHETPVTTQSLPPIETHWTDTFKRTEFLIAGIAVAALLLIGALMWVTVPRYHQEHLLHENPDQGGWDQGVLLGELNTGNPRNAFGTPEVKNSVRFRLTGRRGLGSPQVQAIAMKPFFQVYQNDELRTGWFTLTHGDRIRVRGARFQHYYRFFDRALTPEEYEALVPEAPAATAEEAPDGDQELIIEIPEYETSAAEEEAAAFIDESVGVPEPAAAPHGFAGGESEEMAPQGEPVAEVAAEEAPQFQELDDIFGATAKPADTVEEEPAEADAEAAPEEERGETGVFEKFFDEAQESDGEDLPMEDEEGGDQAQFDDQETIFEKFFGEDDAEPDEEEFEEDVEEEVEEEVEEAETDIDDGTEIVDGADDGILAEAFTMDPDGVFSDGDITKILADSGLDEEGSLVIDLPVDEATGEIDADALFAVGDGEDADDDVDLSPELMRTEEMVPEVDEVVHEESALEDGFNPELMRTDEIVPEVEEVEEEVEEEGESGILSDMFQSESDEEDDDPFSEMRTEIEDGQGTDILDETEVEERAEDGTDIIADTITDMGQGDGTDIIDETLTEAPQGDGTELIDAGGDAMPAQEGTEVIDDGAITPAGEGTEILGDGTEVIAQALADVSGADGTEVIGEDAGIFQDAGDGANQTTVLGEDGPAEPEGRQTLAPNQFVVVTPDELAALKKRLEGGN